MIDPRLQEHLPPSLRLERELPGGGMARVFLATDLSLGRKVVIKILARDLAEGLSSERFRREILLAAQLQHPHLVPVLQAGEADGLPYFVMPYVGGDSLRDRLAAGGPLPVREGVAILRDVARAMAYAHQAGVVHRDIKPGNVLLAGGSAVVSDFGIAKALSSSRTNQGDAALTQTGSSLGTPTYMAPEQAAADPAADHRVDLYAFGVMAYELFTGRPPFHGRSPQALLTAHLAEPPAPLALAAPALPRPLADLVMQCLEKDPARRPAGADEVIARLEEIDWSGERSAPRAALSRPRSTPARLAIGVLVLLVVVAAAGWIWRRTAAARTPLDQHLVTVVPFRVASADPALHYLREGMLDLLAAKLPGEGGLRATEPRLLLDAWRAAGGRESNDLSTQDADRLALRLGAGWLLLGDVVGTPTRVTLNAALLPTGGSVARARVSVEGPPDSLGSLVDQLVSRLLTSVAVGNSASGSAALTRTSLPALRAYLDGVAQLRRGQAGSVQAFHEAVDRDSTFALAALGLIQATAWWNDAALTARGTRLAWRYRSQLSSRDLALLEATLGPRYPEPSPSVEVYAAAQRYLQLAPDRAEAWYIVADKVYHMGEVLGIPDRARRSADGFRKALSLDSTYVPGYIHLQQLAPELGDTALDRRLDRLRAAIDTEAYWRTQQRWYRAVARQDTATMRSMFRTVPPGENAFFYMVSRMPLAVAGSPMDLAMAAYDSLLGRTGGQEAQGLGFGKASLQLVAGQPAAARATLERIAGPDNRDVAAREVFDALLAGGDTAVAAGRIPAIERVATGPPARDSSAAGDQRAMIRALLAWRLNRGDTVGARALLSRYRSLPGFDPGGAAPSLDLISVTALEALYADRTGSPAAPLATARLDSLLARADYTTFSTGRIGFAVLTAGRLLEKYRGPAAALSAVRRRSTWWSNDMPYLAAQLREQGRLAALAGERDEAVMSLRHYLALRPAPEPSQAAEVEAVKKELARLESGRAE